MASLNSETIFKYWCNIVVISIYLLIDLEFFKNEYDAGAMSIYVLS